MAAANTFADLALARRSCYLRINLDRILNNARKLKAKCAKHTELMCVLKGDAYGHGAVPIARHLEKNGFSYFAVATSLEGEKLRQGGVKGYIQILGNAATYEIPTFYNNSLLPTVATVEFLEAWVNYCSSHAKEVESGKTIGQIVIKVDTGMSRNGCQVEDLPVLYEFCKKNGIPVHSIMTNFAQALDDTEFTEKQFDMYLKAVEPYRADGIKLHVCNTPATLVGKGTDLDFVRCGNSLLGHVPEPTDFGIQLTKETGLEPSLTWIARPTLVKTLPPGRVIGYNHTYTCKETETIATLSFGYGDGYSRTLSDRGFVTTKTGVLCPVVGRVSMDAVTVKVPDLATGQEELIVIADDFNDYNSVTAFCKLLNTVPMEVCGRLSGRIPRLYLVNGELKTADCI